MEVHKWSAFVWTLLLSFATGADGRRLLGNIYPGKDWNGNNMAGTPTNGITDYATCHDLCASTSGCVVWTWATTNRCYLKSAGATSAMRSRAAGDIAARLATNFGWVMPEPR